MTRFRGTVGFSKLLETSPGVFTEQITRRTYKGELVREGNRWQPRDAVNDDFLVENRISVVGDQFMYSNVGAMRFIEFMGAKWKISSVEIKKPRIILYLSGVYNGPET